VIAAAGAVWLSGSSWPDLIVAVMMAALFLRGAAEISVQSWRELAKPPVPTAAGEGGQAVPSSDR
jgi:Co/Zn/Cd efflux system component